MEGSEVGKGLGNVDMCVTVRLRAGTSFLRALTVLENLQAGGCGGSSIVRSPQHDPRCSTSPSSRSTSKHATHSLSWLPMAIQILTASCLVEGWVLFKPTPPDCQLARALYRLVRGASKVLLNLDARTRAFLCLVCLVGTEALQYACCLLSGRSLLALSVSCFDNLSN